MFVLIGVGLIGVVLQTVHMAGVCSAVYGPMHYKHGKSIIEVSHSIRVGHSPVTASFCRDITMIVQKATYSILHFLTYLLPSRTEE